MEEVTDEAGAGVGARTQVCTPPCVSLCNHVPSGFLLPQQVSELGKRDLSGGRRPERWTGACSPGPTASLLLVSMLLRDSVGWGVRKTTGSNPPSATFSPLHLQLAT